ncbi:MAG: hypothetical protein AUJ92_05120 [Armatimonadetes bacterium CG2_30_59_28]|nr:hypothetical protein [Armatimonadota bacterium]OIO96815.1 MAG: hypothetical protein AUJ92_05120 [Armatimonadetes bacterium CG2_30_59_28]PIU62210.1 MAG: hypothetical protein COS85_19105 [Armatimonadetes bacterium CG07_land_8_20_14_0_80_59_28]PIX40744.1 MAG: hypothetical protein COZ56_13890 [Armatimonadetes bacterium CG_4_8_14_3_um_filter_58_9]PIY41899.1 MAG: hypothetical protein COZ05_14935 [Armatimonadetes bacterium CG_4_10_14_3_um_filter_59_10]PJB67232.1 MAG: hypothetical protein CO095_123
MCDDPIVAEVRRARDELARKFNYDIQVICADLMRRQGKTISIEELRASAGEMVPTLRNADSAAVSQATERE